MDKIYLFAISYVSRILPLIRYNTYSIGIIFMLSKGLCYSLNMNDVVFTILSIFYLFNKFILIVQSRKCITSI